MAFPDNPKFGTLLLMLIHQSKMTFDQVSEAAAFYAEYSITGTEGHLKSIKTADYFRKKLEIWKSENCPREELPSEEEYKILEEVLITDNRRVKHKEVARRRFRDATKKQSKIRRRPSSVILFALDQNYWKINI